MSDKKVESKKKVANDEEDDVEEEESDDEIEYQYNFDVNTKKVIVSLIFNEPYQLRSLINFGKQSKASSTCLCFTNNSINVVTYSEVSSGNPPFIIVGEIPITSTLQLYVSEEMKNYHGVYVTKDLFQSLSIVKKGNQLRMQILKNNPLRLYMNTEITSPDPGQPADASSVNSDNAYTGVEYFIPEDKPNLRIATNILASRIKQLLVSGVKSININCYNSGIKLEAKDYSDSNNKPVVIGKVEAKEKCVTSAYCSQWLLKALSKVDTSFGPRTTACFYWSDVEPLKLLLPLGSIGKLSIIFMSVPDS